MPNVHPVYQTAAEFAMNRCARMHFSRNITRRSLFVYDRTYPTMAIKKVRFSTDEDNFGGRSAYASIEFNDGRTFILLGFANADLKEIVQRIRPTNPAAIDSTHKRRIQDNFRPGDTFLFVAGIVSFLMFIVWWLMQKFPRPAFSSYRLVISGRCGWRRGYGLRPWN
jgi:hypothetical protein